MQKRGRPKALVETEQVAVRLPKAMIGQFRPNVSKEIRERLARSLFDDTRDQKLRMLEGQIGQLAKEVKFAVGADFHADKIAHRVFIETLKLLFADLVEPSVQTSTIKTAPKDVAEIIYARLKATSQRGAKPTMRTPIRNLLEHDND